MIVESFVQDIRVGLRVLIKEKAFCTLAASVLAIGIAAVATQFAVVNGVLLHAFTFRDSDRLVDVQLVDPIDFSPTQFQGRLTTADFAEMKARQTSFEDFVGYLGGSTVNLTYQGQPRRLQGAYVTHDFFHALGVSPVLGRDFLPEEDRPGVDKAVLISDATWRGEFGADPGVLGKPVRVNGRAGVVIGVMPPKFAFPTNEQLWIPVNAEFPVKPRNDRGINFISIIARLKPGVPMEQAEAEVTTLAQQFAAAYPDTNKQFTRGYVRPLIGAFTGGPLRPLLLTMLGFCVGVLLIACVNVMNMQFARATLRGKELAIRSSLGATRARLIRQMLTESLLIAGIGAVIGIGLAFWSTDYLNAILRNQENPIPNWMSFDIDGVVLAFVVSATMLSAVVSGLVPAWLSSRTRASDVLKESGRGNTGRAVGVITRGLVIVQIVVTCVLLIGALLQTQSIIKQQALNYGYATDAILAARMGLMEGDYPTDAKRHRFYERLLRELRASPQFAATALTSRRQMVFSNDVPIEVEGREYVTDKDRTLSQVENITAGYFNVLGVKVGEGRDFTDLDSDQRDPVAIVNRAFAKKHFGHASPLGRRFRTSQPNGATPSPWRTVVGVVPDLRMQNPFDNRADGTGFYIPYFAAAVGAASPEPLAQQFGTVVVRPHPGQQPEALGKALQEVVKKVDPDLPLYFVATPKHAINSFLSVNRIIAGMFAIFGAVAVILAAVGLYGVMSFSVNQRTQEFGIRMALGADNHMILRMVLRQGGLQLGIGLAGGLGLALAIAILGDAGIRLVLTGISPLDPATFIGVGLLLALVSLVATLVPALRATRVDPMIALRAD